MAENKATIVGAGLAGSLLSVYFAKRGIEVDIYERRPDMRTADAGGGKSINLALSTRGIHALKEVGLYDEIKKISIPMYGRQLHAPDGTLSFQRYGKDDSEYINAVSRAELNKSLMDLAEQITGTKIRFDSRCTGIDFDRTQLKFRNDKTGQDFTVDAGAVISTDGATSAVRMEMMKIPRFNFSQVYENYGYKELTIPAGKDGGFLMEKNALHIWPRGSFMLIALPNLDGTFTCTLFLPYDRSLGGENSLEHLESRENLVPFFRKNFSDALDLMPDIEEQYYSHPTGTLITIKCFPWTFGKNVTLLGDSAHAIVPFFGQGMNAAFEDCTYLNALLNKHGNDWPKVFREYEQVRKKDTDAIADLAQENFIEMRDLVATKKFQFRKKIEAELYKHYPERYIPKYSMVTFMRVPYSIALKRGQLQEHILEMLSEGIESIEELDRGKAEHLIFSMLEPIEEII
jgi:kynurenine 3-monooxygenase